MSSFRPDPAYAPPTFRPARPGVPAGAGFVGEGASATAASAANASAKLAAPACTPAQHAELERLAFERGVASAQVDQARCEQACETLEAAAAELARVSMRLLYESRDAIVGLAAEIARSYLGDELRQDPTRYAAPVERALAVCADDAAATVFFAPDVLATLDATLPAWSERGAGKPVIEFGADPALAAGGFRIETSTRSLDASFDGLAARLREALASAFEAAAPGPASDPSSEASAC